MIYEIPSSNSPVQQGDIFRYIPRIDINLEQLSVVDGDDFYERNWVDLTGSGGNSPITTVVAIRPVTAIVITQDCDAVRVDDIALAEIVLFEQVMSDIVKAKYPEKTWGIITKQSRLNLRWFYLPIDESIGFAQRMAVDFHSVLRTSRFFLERNIAQFRVARLKEIAYEHFREKLSEYYRRYPYDEWYPLDKNEYQEYRKSKNEPVDPFDWQK
jgi:hypothetical protein